MAEWFGLGSMVFTWRARWPGPLWMVCQFCVPDVAKQDAQEYDISFFVVLKFYGDSNLELCSLIPLVRFGPL